MAEKDKSRALVKQIASELGINKISLTKSVNDNENDGWFRQHLYHALDALNEGIRIGFSGLAFPESGDIVREVALDAAVTNIPILDWSIGTSDEERDPLRGAIARKALEVVEAVIDYGGDAAKSVLVLDILDKNRAAIAKGALAYPTWAHEYRKALKLTQKGTRGFTEKINKAIKSRDASRSIATSNYYKTRR